MVQNEFIQEYTADYIPKDHDHGIREKVQEVRFENKCLYQVCEPIRANDNRVKDRSLPKRMVLSKCPSSDNNSSDDIMALKMKVLSQGSMLD